MGPWGPWPWGPLGLGDPWALGTPGPWGPLGLGMGSQGGPFGPMGPWGPGGPWGPLGVGDPGPWGPWALGTHEPLGPMSPWDPWALGPGPWGPYTGQPYFFDVHIVFFIWSYSKSLKTKLVQKRVKLIPGNSACDPQKSRALYQKMSF